MARYSSEIIDEVRQSNDIVDVIAQYVTLKRRGRNYFGLCPFHNEKSPSFSVSPDKQIFRCFGCGVGGDVFSFVGKINGMTFYETVQTLAERANITLPTLDKQDSAKEALKQKVYKVNEFAAEFYHKRLYEPTSKDAQEYVKKRKLSNETLKSFKIGYSGKFNELYQELVKQGFQEQEILESGLVNKNEDGKFIDRYRKRLMFPICDARGKVIAFGGRVLDDSKPKYINSPENVVYIKGRHLFGLNVAKKHDDIKKRLLIVEGYMDVISLHQRGITNVVAALGTALTESQGYLLRNNTERIILSFDSDQAGQIAIDRSIKILQNMGCDIRILQMEGAKDPDEYVLKYGSARFNNLLDKAISVIEFKVKNLKQKLNIENTNDRIKFLKEIAKLIAKVDSSLEREVYIENISKTYGVSKEAIYAEVNKLAYNKNNDQKKLNSDKKIVTKNDTVKLENISKAVENRENTILSLLLTGDMTVYEKIKEQIKPEDYQRKGNKEIATKLYEEFEKGNSNINSILSEMTEEQKSYLTKFMIDEYEIENKEKAAQDVLKAYQKDKLNQRKNELVVLLEKEQDEQKKKQYEGELRDIITKIVKIK